MNQLPPCSQHDYPCPYAYLCDRERPEEMLDPALDVLASEYEEWREVEASAKSAKAVARDAIVAHGGAVTANWSVTVSETAGRASLDEKAMEADGIDLAKYRKVGKGSTRVTVTKRGADGFGDA